MARRAPEAGDGFPRSRPSGEAAGPLDGHLATLDICYGPVNTLPEAIADANLQKRGFMVTDDEGRLHFGPVVRFKDEPSSPLYREPLLGEHTDEVLRR